MWLEQNVVTHKVQHILRIITEAICIEGVDIMQVGEYAVFKGGHNLSEFLPSRKDPREGMLNKGASCSQNSHHIVGDDMDGVVKAQGDVIKQVVGLTRGHCIPTTSIIINPTTLRAQTGGEEVLEEMENVGEHDCWVHFREMCENSFVVKGQ